MIKAEQELGAFFSAVKELSGSAQPELSAENWLHELPAMSRLPLINSRMATATVKVSARIASRVNAPKEAFDSRDRISALRKRGRAKETWLPRQMSAFCKKLRRHSIRS